MWTGRQVGQGIGVNRQGANLVASHMTQMKFFVTHLHAAKAYY